MKTIQDRVAVVTGAGSGIGREVALALAAAGAKVAAVDLRLDTARETVERIRATTKDAIAAAYPADVADRKDVEKMANMVRTSMGAPAILVNNAGVMIKTQPLLDVPYEHLELAIAVNVWGVVHCTKTLLPDLLAQPEASIVNVSSMGGLVGWMSQVPYTMTKFAVRGFSEALRMELLDSSVRVTTAYPGHIDTRVTENSPTLTDEEKQVLRAQLAKTKPGSPVEVARKIVRAIRTGQARVLIRPETYVIDTIARTLPGSAVSLLHPLVKKMLGAGTVPSPEDATPRNTP
ncbi:MAG TPA: SDR family NAD(P)-dependent oxidoreductase [Nevskiaceae bacterium]|nr:SDR family NAD(P)-dependent oxidoreductase [Nevskiaceae bacterium]